MSGPGRSAGRTTSIGLRLLVVGAIALAFGISMTDSTADGVIECDGAVMGPGDACITASSSRAGSYEDLVERERASAASSREAAPIVIAAGALVAGGSAIVLLVTLARRPPGRAGSGDGGSAPGSGSQWW